MGSGCSSRHVVGGSARVVPAGECCHRLDKLPGRWPELLAQGQLYTAIVLSTVYNDKNRGRAMQPGQRAEVALPSGKSRGFTLRRKAGIHDCSAFIWLGDEAEGDATIYIGFTPLRSLSQAAKMTVSGGLVKEELPRSSLVTASGAAAGGGSSPSGASWRRPSKPSTGPGPAKFRMAAYIKRQLDVIWASDPGIGDLVASAAVERPGWRVLFCGISYGAVMAQACALRFTLAHPALDAHAVTWNACKWIDQAGSVLVGEVMGDRLLSLTLSRQKGGATRHWDSWAGFPPSAGGWSSLPQLVLLDADDGSVLSCQCIGDSYFGPNFVRRASELHFAKTAIRATRTATLAALGKSAGEFHTSLEMADAEVLSGEDLDGGDNEDDLQSPALSPRSPLEGQGDGRTDGPSPSPPP